MNNATRQLLGMKITDNVIFSIDELLVKHTKEEIVNTMLLNSKGFGIQYYCLVGNVYVCINPNDGRRITCIYVHDNYMYNRTIQAFFSLDKAIFISLYLNASMNRKNIRIRFKKLSSLRKVKSKKIYCNIDYELRSK